MVYHVYLAQVDYIFPFSITASFSEQLQKMGIYNQREPNIRDIPRTRVVESVSTITYLKKEIRLT